MTEQQWQGLLRLALMAGGTWLANKGLVSADMWGSVIVPDVITGVGSLAAAGTVWWTWWSHKPKTIIATADKLKEQGK